MAQLARLYYSVLEDDQQQIRHHKNEQYDDNGVYLSALGAVYGGMGESHSYPKCELST